MTIPNLSDLSAYEPRWLGVRELNIGDAWRARWVDASELPDGVRATHAYAVILFNEKGYICRRRGEETWDTLEGEIPESHDPESFLKSIARDRIGAELRVVELIGYLDCRATSHNPEHEPGTATVRPFYTLAAKKVADAPADPAYERRRLPVSDFMLALRRRYPEYEPYVSAAIERYLVLKARGKAS